MEYLWFLWFLCPIIGGWIAHKKKRRVWLWAIISYFTIWGIIVLIFLPSKKVVKDGTINYKTVSQEIYDQEKEKII